MKKRKIALFYDESTESGRQRLEFLTPFDKRKSDPKRTIEGKSVAASKKSPDTSVTQQNETEENKTKMPSEPEHDVSLIKAGLASFL